MSVNNIVQQVFKKVYGKPSWQVHKGYGSSITFEFGKPKLKVSKKVLRPKAGRKWPKYPQRTAKVRGDWHLWIYCCDWEIRQDGRRIGHSESEDKKINQACSILNGQILTSVVVDPRSLRTDFSFDLGGHLQTKPSRGEVREMWMLKCSNGRWFCVRADGKYSYQSGNTQMGEKRWLPLSV
jgi:hypothetical protein